MISTTEQSSSSSTAAAQRISDNDEAPCVIDFCSGLGGLSSAASELGMRILAGVDTNAEATKTFKRNFAEAVVFEGSVRSSKILASCRTLAEQSSKTGAPLVIVSGPPCQGFSVAGSRDPKDKRNKVLVAVAQAIASLQPDCALIENVSMVLADKYEKRLDSFKQVLVCNGYFVTRVLLDASDFGVAQRRKRAFFLVTRHETSEAEVLESLGRFKTSPKPTREALEGLPPARVRPNRYSDEMEEAIAGVFNHIAMQHSSKVQAKIAAIPPGKGPMSYRRLHPDRPSNTLFSGHRAPPAHYSEPRSITVREAARLQGFPDSFRIFGSFGNQMAQVTNAVPPPLARVVLTVLTESCGIKLP